MFILIISLIVFVGVMIFALIADGWQGFAETIGIPFILSLISALIVFLFSIILSELAPNSVINEVNRSEVQLIALKDNMAVESHYNGRYVYRGYIDEKLQYTYLYEEVGKGITSGSCDADDTYINYIKGAEQPKLIIVEHGIAHPIWKFFTANNILGARYRCEYYLYVPEGSIVTESQYEIDLE